MNQRHHFLIGTALMVTMFTAFTVIIAPVFGFGQVTMEEDNRIVIGERVKLQSEILHEERTILIYRPANYNYSQSRYPVLYLLDGNFHFHHVTGIIQYLSQQRLIPSMIVVAIPNTNRDRDLLPTNMPHVPASGGGDNFLKFIKTELIPFVDNNYRTHPYRILVGHSFGGLFAVYTLLTQPELFEAYIAISPSLHWGDMLVLKKAMTLFQRKLSFKKFLYMTMGNETNDMLVSIKNFCKILKEKAPPDLKWHYTFMKNEDHGSTPHRSIYDGLEALYSGWRLPQKSFLDGLKSIGKHYKGLSKKYGYDIPIPEYELNRLGYTLLGQKQTEKALDIFKRNVELYPGSPNVYDSLGEAYEAANQLEEAKKNYEMACQKANEVAYPNTEVFKRHLMRVMKKMASSE
jgi:predicted alpha/beta superfamily hydrolase